MSDYARGGYIAGPGSDDDTIPAVLSHGGCYIRLNDTEHIVAHRDGVFRCIRDHDCTFTPLTSTLASAVLAKLNAG